MQNITQEYNNETYKRITRPKAQKRMLLMAGPTYIAPVKARFGPWVQPLEIPFVIGWCKEDFNNYVNEFVYYNCNAEMGNYPAFYVKESDLSEGFIF